MSAPSLSNDFAIPAGFELSRANLNALFGEIASTLKTLQGTASNMQAVIDAGTTEALEMVTENVLPYFQQVQASAAAAQTALQQAQDIATAIIENGAVSADYIVETSSRVFVTPAQKSSLASAASADDIVSYVLALG